MPRPRKIEPEKNCETCHEPLTRKRFSGRLEDLGVFLRRRFCGKPCSQIASRKAAPTRDAYRKRARPMRKMACETCGATTRLSIHHDDRNWRNNAPENLKTLCASCHTTLHHARGEIVKRRLPTARIGCDVSATPSSQPKPNSPSACCSSEP